MLSPASQGLPFGATRNLRGSHHPSDPYCRPIVSPLELAIGIAIRSSRVRSDSFRFGLRLSQRTQQDARAHSAANATSSHVQEKVAEHSVSECE